MRGWAYAGQFVRRYAQPYVIGKQGGYGAIGDFVSKLFGFSNGGAAAIGKDDEISLHQLTGNGEAFELIERLANARIQKLILGRVKTADLVNGSRAAQETEEDTRKDRISGYLDLLARALQHALDAMLAVNAQYGRTINAPQGLWFEYQKEDEIDIVRAQRDQIYLQSGLALTKDYFTDIVGYEAEHVAGIKEQEASIQAAEKGGIQLSAAHQHPHLPDLPDGAAQDKLEQQIMSGKIAALMAALDHADDYESFQKSLVNLQLPENILIDDLVKKATESFNQGYQSKS